MRSVLVTGGEGYIGRHITAALTDAGFKPIVVDLRSAVPCDVRVREAFEDAVDLVNPLGIIHLAAHSDVAESMRDPAKYAENAAMSAVVSDVCARLPVVLASSAAVYGEADDLPIEEDAELAPLNPYGASKIASEALLPDAMRLRFFNVAGGRDPNAHVIPRILKALCLGEEIEIEGDGAQVRDFVHVDDVASAVVLALRAMLDGERGRALNICSGNGASVRDVVATCERASGKRASIRSRDPRPGDPRRLVGYNRRAWEVLGWEPKRHLDEIVSSAWRAAA